MANNAELALIDPSLLPPQMRQLVSVIGLPDTLILLNERGGTLFRFPHNADNSVLADIVGIEAARKLSIAFGGQTWELPKSDKILIKIRNVAVRKARKQHSASKVATMFSLTRRHVINLSHEDDEPTPDLFVDTND